MGKNILATILLALILFICRHFLRFTGQNWDDFTYTHPDERFLTLNLLPQVGGGNEYTPDEKNFPAQKNSCASGCYRHSHPFMIFKILRQRGLGLRVIRLLMRLLDGWLAMSRSSCMKTL